MKTLLFITLFSITVSLTGQDCLYYFNFDKGTELTYNMFDEKDKPTGTMYYKVLDKKRNEGKEILTIESSTLDKKGKAISSVTFDIICEQNTMHIDIKSILTPETLEAYQEMEIEMNGDYLTLPKNLTPGEKLNDGILTIKVSSSGFQIVKMDLNIHDRRVEKKEKISVPAGSFDTYVIYSKTSLQMIVNIETGSREWYSEKIGLVKSETLNSAGKVTGYTVLASIK